MKIFSSSALAGVPPISPPGPGPPFNCHDSKCKGPGVEVSLICLRKMGERGDHSAGPCRPLHGLWTLGKMGSIESFEQRQDAM